MQKIVPFLWFNNQAEEAANLYVSLFNNSRIKSSARYDEAGAKASGMPVGSVMTVEFELEGQNVIALNGGPAFNFNESVSFVIDCENQEEVDKYWNSLTADGGVPGQCGWLKDKFGLSWQVVPRALNEMLADKDPEKSKRVMEAMLKMQKIEVEGLKQAYNG